MVRADLRTGEEVTPLPCPGTTLKPGPEAAPIASRTDVLYGPFINNRENTMKRLIALLAVLLLCFAAGCKKNPRSIIQLPEEPEYVGAYLDTTDVRRIGHALNSAPTRTPIQWENLRTGYQFSMMVFSTDQVADLTTRTFTVLTIADDGDAEVLNLLGRSNKKKVWRIVAQSPASRVGKAVRMQLTDTPVPEAVLSSGRSFNGFVLSK